MDRQQDRKTDRQKDRQAGGQTDSTKTLPNVHKQGDNQDLHAGTVDFGEISNISRLTEQAGKLRYMILYFHIKIQQCVFSILQ